MSYSQKAMNRARSVTPDRGRRRMSAGIGNGKGAAAAAMLLFLLAPTVGLGHPVHSEAIRRISELRMPGGKETIKGHCSFHVSGGYVIFEFLPMEAKGSPGGRVYSGVIHIYRSTGSLFQAEGGPLGQGPVTLAEPSSDVVHLKSGVLASWENGCALLVSGDPLKKDHQCAGCSLLITRRTDDTPLKKLMRIRPQSAQTSPSESHDDQHPLESPILSKNQNHEVQKP